MDLDIAAFGDFVAIKRARSPPRTARYAPATVGQEWPASRTASA